GGDVLHAEAEDFSGRDNANMSTPSDGFSPRMQMFVWAGLETVRQLTIDGLGPIATTRSASAAGARNFNVTGPVVVIDDGTAPGSDGCQAITTPLAGQVVLLDRS